MVSYGWSCHVLVSSGSPPLGSPSGNRPQLTIKSLLSAEPVLVECYFHFQASIWLFAQHHVYYQMFQFWELRANDFNEFRFSVVPCLRFESFFFQFCKFFALAMFAGTLCTISTKANEQHAGGGNITIDFMVSKLAEADKEMSLLTSLMVSVFIALEFTVGSTSTSNVCNDSSSKLFPCVLIKVFRIPLAILICLSQIFPMRLAVGVFILRHASANTRLFYCGSCFGRISAIL